jgi:hypothetical protein
MDGTRLRVLVLVVLVGVAIGLPAYFAFVRDPRGGAPTPAATDSAVGIVVAVESTSPTQVSAFTLRTDAGESLRFEIGAVDLREGFDPNHLREHQALVTPVLVDYTSADGRRVAVRLRDAPTG